MRGQIRQATQEQDRAAVQITEAVGAMNRLTFQVLEATREQAKGSERIVPRPRCLRKRRNCSSSRALLEAIAFVKDDSHRAVERTIPAVRPESLLAGR